MQPSLITHHPFIKTVALCITPFFFITCMCAHCYCFPQLHLFFNSVQMSFTFMSCSSVSNMPCNVVFPLGYVNAFVFSVWISVNFSFLIVKSNNIDIWACQFPAAECNLLVMSYLLYVRVCLNSWDGARRHGPSGSCGDATEVEQQWQHKHTLQLLRGKEEV